MAYNNHKIAVVMPAYKAAKTLRACYEAVPKDLVDEIILVDDASPDNTVAVAKSLPIRVHVHKRNLGYGGNQKTCYRLAREAGSDIVVMVHPDHQYDPSFVPQIVQALVDGGYDAVFGSRMMIRENARAGGMPYWKYLSNIMLTKIGNFLLGTDLTEFHSGFRAYRTSVFEKIDISQNSDNFVFDTEIIIQLVDTGLKIKEIPISTRYFPEASQIGFWPSVRYGLSILYHLILYKTGLRKLIKPNTNKTILFRR